MSAQTQYNTLRKLVDKSLTITESEFESLVPAKLRGKPECKEIYTKVTKELKSRKKKCYELIQKIPEVFDGKISIKEVKKRVEKMKVLDKSAKMSVDKLKQELNKRKNTTKKIEKIITEVDIPNQETVESVYRLCKDIKMELG
ncbi:hypothetical protein WA171_006993 [Blastocystis sp. BT1]